MIFSNKRIMVLAILSMAGLLIVGYTNCSSKNFAKLTSDSQEQASTEVTETTLSEVIVPAPTTGFIISPDELASIIQIAGPNKPAICKLFARNQVAVGETISFMVVRFDSNGKEIQTRFKDSGQNTWDFPFAGNARIDFIGSNPTGSAAGTNIRERAPIESQRLGNAVFNYNDPQLAGDYTRQMEIFDENGNLYCRTNIVSVKLLGSGVKVDVKPGQNCLNSDVPQSVGSYTGQKLCPGYRTLGTDVEKYGVGNNVGASAFYGSIESNAQFHSRMQGGEYCASGRALVSRVRTYNGMYLVEDECLN